MLVDVRLVPGGTPNFILDILSDNKGEPRVRKLRTGVYLVSHHNFKMEVIDELVNPLDSPSMFFEFDETLYSESGIARMRSNKISALEDYGIVDSLEQLLEIYDFDTDPRKLVIALTEVNRATQSPTGGWRFHKWGEYFGTHRIDHEYLYDCTNIDKVYTFSIHQVKG